MSTHAIGPHSMFLPDYGYLVAGRHAGAGANSHKTAGLKNRTTVAALAEAHMEFALPDPLPQGSPYLVIVGVCAAPGATQYAKIKVEWGVAGDGEDPSSLTLNDEGTQTITWTTSDDDTYNYTAVALDAASWAVTDKGKYLIVHATYHPTGWTLTSPVVWQYQLIWI